MEDIFKNAMGFVQQTANSFTKAAEDSMKQFSQNFLPTQVGATKPQSNKISFQLPTPPPAQAKIPVQSDSDIIGKWNRGEITRDQADQMLNINTPPPKMIPVAPVQAPIPVGQPAQGVLTPAQIDAGFRAYNPNSPLIGQGEALSRAMQTIANSGTKINPLDLLTFLLRESSGGITEAQKYNPGNVRDSTGRHGYVAYPDYNTAINGGWNPEYGVQSQGIIGTILNDPRYAEYRNTGNPNAFNATWTPQADNNPSAQELTQWMESFKKYFKKELKG